MSGFSSGGSALPNVLVSTTAAFTTAQETKLAGIEAGATANASDAALRDRATHTGTQAISTVTGLQDALGTIPSITVGTIAPSSPSVGDLWVDTN